MSYHDDDPSSGGSTVTPPYPGPRRASTQTTKSTSKTASSTPSKPSQPLDQAHVGRLPECISTLNTLEAILKKKVSRLSELESVEDVTTLFRRPQTNSTSYTSPLTDPSSPWQQFQISELTAHKQYLDKIVLAWADQSSATLRSLQLNYLQRWRRNQMLRMAPDQQQTLARLAELLDELVQRLGVKEKRGPFRPGLESECRELLSEGMSLMGQFGAMKYISTEKKYMKAREGYQDAMTTKILKSMELPGRQPSQNSSWLIGTNDKVEMWDNDEEKAMGRPLVDMADTPDSIRTPSLFSRIASTTTSRLRSKRFWFAEMVVIFVSLLIAVPWSVLKDDPQTGFTIGAFVVAAGTLLVAGGMKLSAKQREREAEGVGVGKVMVD